MREATFQAQIGRLKNQFGAQTYGQERVTVLWQALQAMSDEWFEQTVSRFIGSTLKPPLLPEFQAAKAETSLAKAAGRSAALAKCSLCNDGGWLLEPFNREDTSPPLAMRCECKGGPKALAERIRNHPDKPDRALADRIEATFHDVHGYTFKTQGMRRA